MIQKIDTFYVSMFHSSVSDYFVLTTVLIWRFFILFLDEPNCGEGASFDDYSRHGKWRMNNSPLFKTAGGYGDAEFESSLRVWATNEVPAIRYFAGKR